MGKMLEVLPSGARVTWTWHGLVASSLSREISSILYLLLMMTDFFFLSRLSLPPFTHQQPFSCTSLFCVWCCPSQFRQVLRPLSAAVDGDWPTYWRSYSESWCLGGRCSVCEWKRPSLLRRNFRSVLCCCWRCQPAVSRIVSESGFLVERVFRSSGNSFLFLRRLCPCCETHIERESDWVRERQPSCKGPIGQVQNSFQGVIKRSGELWVRGPDLGGSPRGYCPSPFCCWYYTNTPIQKLLPWFTIER